MQYTFAIIYKISVVVICIENEAVSMSQFITIQNLLVYIMDQFFIFLIDEQLDFMMYFIHRVTAPPHFVF